MFPNSSKQILIALHKWCNEIHSNHLIAAFIFSSSSAKELALITAILFFTKSGIDPLKSISPMLIIFVEVSFTF